MVAWLVPISLYWTLTAVYLGVAPVQIEGGGGVQQILGIALHYASYLGAFAAIRSVLTGSLGAILGGIVVPVVVASLLLPMLGKVVFRLVGVRIVAT